MFSNHSYSAASCQTLFLRPAFAVGRLVFLCLFGSGLLAADETIPDATAQTLAQFRTRISQLQTAVSAQPGDVDTRPNLDRLKAAEDELDLIEKQRQAIDQRTKEIGGLPAKAKSRKSDAQPEPTVNPSTYSDADLESRLATRQAELAATQRELDRLEKAAVNPAERRNEWERMEGELAKSLDQIENQLQALPEEQTNLDSQVAATTLSINKLRVMTDIEAIDVSRAFLDAELELNLPALELTNLKTKFIRVESELKALRAEKEKRRAAESARQLADARAAEEQATKLENPRVRALVPARREHVNDNQTLTSSIGGYVRRLESRKELIKELQSGFNRLKEEIHRFGSDASVGRRLLYFKNEFPDPDAIRSEIEADVREDAQLYVDRREYDAAMEYVTALETESLSDADRRYVEEYKEALTSLQENVEVASLNLFNLVGENKTLLKLQAEWEDFANEHLLWLPSHPSARHFSVDQVAADAAAVTSETGSAIVAVFSLESVSLWVVMAPLLVACIALLVLEHRSRDRIEELGLAARRGSCGTMDPTLRTMLLTFLVAAEWPLIIMLLGNVFRLASQTGPALALGRAMIAFGLLMLWMNSVRQSLRRGGLVESHFDWDQALCDIIRRWFHSVIMTCGFALLLFFVVHHQRQTSETAALERVIFVAVMLLISSLLAKLLLPPHSKLLVKRLTADSAILHRTRWAWTVVPVSIPIVFAGLSLVGYHHTALQLNDRLAWTLMAASIALLAHQLMVRWMKVSRTRARLQLAKQRAEERAARQAAEAAGELDGEITAQKAASPVPATPADDEEMELFGLQAHSLVRNAALLAILGCVWGIWSDVLPALRKIDRYVIIPAQVITVDAADGTEGGGTQLKTIRDAVTVGHIVFAAFALALTIVAVRQLPGLIEVVLQSRGYETGLRYAVSTISRYTVLVAGTLTVAYTIGLRWTQVQWLAAGLSVGLGFGLQEIFANFISGIIILVERPVRIGDVVTLDGVSGVVSRIRIRATSITDWDRREYIVPNREFVTGKLLNWTLTDTTNRVVLNVGISYDCDTELAREIMLQVAADHPGVLEDPAPIATFEGFGDSALDLVLRAYLPNLDNRLSVTTQLHSEVHIRFAAAGLNIPFPQRDLNVYMKDPPEPGRQSPIGS